MKKTMAKKERLKKSQNNLKIAEEAKYFLFSKTNLEIQEPDC